MPKILLAEDDQNLGLLVEENLQELGYEVFWGMNGVDAGNLFNHNKVDLCLIDVMMPEMDGFELAKKIRSVNEFVPILFLTAKSFEEDRLHGFEIGGDDYITKPFSMKELDYRIKVFLKRNESVSEITTERAEALIFGNSSFDPHNLVYRCDGVEHSLTQMEAQLLELLVQHKNALVKREHILEKIWGENDYFKGRSLDVFITRLRKYLRADNRLEIKNHHGVGFSLTQKKS
ncbi:MAG: response regulator transcription factor [Ekhidna sp.]